MKTLGLRLITIQFLDHGVLVETLELDEVEPVEPNAGTPIFAPDQPATVAHKSQYACSTIEGAKDLVDSLLDAETEDEETVH